MILIKSKNLDYWKKKLLAVLKGDVLEKSLSDILYPGIMLKALEKDLLIKARGFSVGTVRTWSGKEYKKLSSGKWMRTYTGTGERGERQAIRNVMKAIQGASSMEELAEIINKNMQRFKDESGKTLPVVKEFMTAARGSKSGEKDIKRDDINQKIKDLKNKLSAEGGKAGIISNKLKDGFKPHRGITGSNKDGWQYQLKDHLGNKVKLSKTGYEYARALLESEKHKKIIVKKTDGLDEFRKLAKESKNVNEFMSGVQKIKNVPPEVSQAFREKYDPEHKLTTRETAQKFMDDVKGKEPETPIDKKAKVQQKKEEVEKRTGKKFKDMTDEEQDEILNAGIVFHDVKVQSEKIKDKPGNETWIVSYGKDKYRVNKTKNGWRVSDAKADFSIIGLKFSNSPEEAVKLFKEGKDKKTLKKSIIIVRTK